MRKKFHIVSTQEEKTMKGINDKIPLWNPDFFTRFSNVPSSLAVEWNRLKEPSIAAQKSSETF